MASISIQLHDIVTFWPNPVAKAHFSFDDQQFPKKKIGHFPDVLRWQGMEKAAANLNRHETGNGRYSQGDT
jgi:hypothetical protein